MKIHVLTVEHKPVENRSRGTSFRGELYIHASKSFDYEAIDGLMRAEGGK